MTQLFQTVAAGDDPLFVLGETFKPKEVADFLSLKNEDVAKIAGVSKQSVRFDKAIPNDVRERMEEIANICNMVAGFFDRDHAKTALWFRTKNPMLGDISPRDMLRFGRYDKLRRFIVGALADRDANRRARAKHAA